MIGPPEPEGGSSRRVCDYLSISVSVAGSMVRADKQCDGELVVARGRGTSLNPGNRFDEIRLVVLEETRAAARREHPDGVRMATRVYDDHSRWVSSTRWTAPIWASRGR